MVFKYTVLDAQGAQQSGVIDALDIDVAINALQRRGFVISSIEPVEAATPFWQRHLKIFERVSTKEVVIVSRQIATLFEAQVSALQVFRLLAVETENPRLRAIMDNISSDLQAGSTISNAMAKHSEVFSNFYVNMVKAGEESGKLDETFMYLADYLERTFEVMSKAKNALIYPAFVITTFIAVMILMLTIVIPKISGILKDSGQEIPVYTKVVIGISDFFVNYGLILAIGVVIGIFILVKFARTHTGATSIDSFKLSVPYVGNLYQKLYLSRIADNMTTMLQSGIPMVKALELTLSVVENKLYQDALSVAVEKVKGGSAVSEALSKTGVIPNIMVQMMRVGEETGNLGEILSTLARFYRREVVTAVDTLVDLIEPVMIVLLGLGVSVLLASVLIPIYNISSTF